MLAITSKYTILNIQAICTHDAEWMSAILIVRSSQFIPFYNQDELTLNVGYYICPGKYILPLVETQ